MEPKCICTGARQDEGQSSQVPRWRSAWSQSVSAQGLWPERSADSAALRQRSRWNHSIFAQVPARGSPGSHVPRLRSRWSQSIFALVQEMKAPSQSVFAQGRRSNNVFAQGHSEGVQAPRYCPGAADGAKAWLLRGPKAGLRGYLHACRGYLAGGQPCRGELSGARARAKPGANFGQTLPRPCRNHAKTKQHLNQTLPKPCPGHAATNVIQKPSETMPKPFPNLA